MGKNEPHFVDLFETRTSSGSVQDKSINYKMQLMFRSDPMSVHGGPSVPDRVTEGHEVASGEFDLCRQTDTHPSG